MDSHHTRTGREGRGPTPAHICGPAALFRQTFRLKEYLYGHVLIHHPQPKVKQFPIPPCIPKKGRTFAFFGFQRSHSCSAINSDSDEALHLTPGPCSLLPAFLGGRAYSALPCAGAPPPQRPLSYTARRCECVRNMTLSTRGNRASPHLPSGPAGAGPVPAPSRPKTGLHTCPHKSPWRPSHCPATRPALWPDDTRSPQGRKNTA